jgi:hypothetical protein
MRRLIKKNEKIYSWDEIINEQHNGSGRISCEPFGDYDKSKFCLKKISINSIPSKYYMTIDEFKEYGDDESISIIESIMISLDDDIYIPPIVLDKSLNVIDGSHRLSAYRELGIYNIMAFVEV